MKKFMGKEFMGIVRTTFIFDEKALRVDREDLELIHDNNRKKNYLAIRVNEDSFFDYIKASYEN